MEKKTTRKRGKDEVPSPDPGGEQGKRYDAYGLNISNKPVGNLDVAGRK